MNHHHGGASGAVNRWLRPDSVRHMSVTTATRRLTAAHHETRRHNNKKARETGKTQLTGYLCRWWQVLGSNQRRLSRRFYRGLPGIGKQGRSPARIPSRRQPAHVLNHPSTEPGLPVQLCPAGTAIARHSASPKASSAGTTWTRFSARTGGERAPAIRDHHERIGGRDVGPPCRQREQFTVLVVEMNPVLAPVRTAVAPDDVFTVRRYGDTRSQYGRG